MGRPPTCLYAADHELACIAIGHRKPDPARHGLEPAANSGRARAPSANGRLSSALLPVASRWKAIRYARCSPACSFKVAHSATPARTRNGWRRPARRSSAPATIDGARRPANPRSEMPHRCLCLAPVRQGIRPRRSRIREGKSLAQVRAAPTIVRATSSPAARTFQAMRAV